MVKFDLTKISTKIKKRRNHWLLYIIIR